MDEAGFERVESLSQLCICRDELEQIAVVFAKVTDDLLMSGTASELEIMSELISSRFELQNVIVNDTVTFNGCEI